jgi:hypothetical protein
MHYLAIARLFSSGYNEVLGVLMSGDNLGYNRIMPGSVVEVLRVFARCKENQLVDGRYKYWFRDNIIGNNPDHDLLEKFTAIMLLLAPKDCPEVFHLISVEHLSLIKSGKKKIEYYGNLLKGDKDLCDHFPQIAEINIRARIQSAIRLFEKANKTNLASIDLPKHLINEFEGGFYTIFNANKEYVLDGVNADDSSNKTERVEMGGYTCQLYKQPFVAEREIDVTDYCWDEAQKFKSRYQYMVYSALSQMNITDISLPVKDFEAYFVKRYGRLGEDYMIIDSDSLMPIFCDFDKNPRNTISVLHRQFRGADHRLYDLSIGWYLRDIPELEPFKKTIVIIKKQDLPFVYSTINEDKVSISLDDESDNEKGLAVVRITVNPNWAIRYNREAKIVRVLLTGSR